MWHQFFNIGTKERTFVCVDRSHDFISALIVVVKTFAIQMFLSAGDRWKLLSEKKKIILGE